MNDILNRLTVLFALAVFLIVAVVGMATGVDPMVCLFRATIAFVFFGFFGRLGIRVILRGILEELAKHKETETGSETNQNDTKASVRATPEAPGRTGAAESE